MIPKIKITDTNGVARYIDPQSIFLIEESGENLVLFCLPEPHTVKFEVNMTIEQLNEESKKLEDLVDGHHMQRQLRADMAMQNMREQAQGMIQTPPKGIIK